jgi:RNA polymerase sigma factor (sigma-70 family)
VSDVLPRIEACIPALRRYATALLRSRQDADDMVHDTLVRALDRLHTRREDGDVRAWLFTIMHNLFVSRIRRSRLRVASDPAAATPEEPAVPAGQEEGLRWRDLLRALGQLAPEQRQVILLVAVEDLTYAEAARVLDIPIGTVMSRLARGRERLRELATAPEAARPGLRRVK